MTNIVTYLRATITSNLSIPGQRAALAAHLECIGATAADEFIDITMYGPVTKRPGLEALLEHIDRNPGTIVLVCAADRLTRSRAAFRAIQKRFAEAGAKLIFAS